MRLGHTHTVNSSVQKACTAVSARRCQLQHDHHGAPNRTYASRDVAPVSGPGGTLVLSAFTLVLTAAVPSLACPAPVMKPTWRRSMRHSVGPMVAQTQPASTRRRGGAPAAEHGHAAMPPCGDITGSLAATHALQADGVMCCGLQGMIAFRRTTHSQA